MSLSGRGVGGAGGVGGGNFAGIDEACLIDVGTGNASTASLADSPETLPWLIRLDKFVEDQQHEGVTEFVVRSNNFATSINEAVALELLAEAGLATQEATAARFAFNGSDAELRLVMTKRAPMRSDSCTRPRARATGRTGVTTRPTMRRCGTRRPARTT